ncbi:hypothetical protein [Rhizobium sp. LC145]|uniref:hypothetical protein n=1 Tax=Rhizobium sp. LC145 TaxID=1120688 RepID=UPI00062A4A04|nr:hypothetical protein [Rhizobium sp. LC145]KKX33970.1 hypothetical protein YH62_02015 [Rhizobium sp. LC145]TKT67064.1 hypothetical protein FDR95_05140 [Rhizobiaceae bacterium LC148]
MKYSHVEIGRHFDADGNPLVVADGRIVGSVADVKAMISSFEDQSRQPEKGESGEPRQVMLIGFGLGTVTILA